MYARLLFVVVGIFGRLRARFPAFWPALGLPAAWQRGYTLGRHE
ncbi:hypothetical protein ACVJGD_002488 [Bradyrhizobium sp. USDA 10063]